MVVSGVSVFMQGCCGGGLYVCWGKDDMLGWLMMMVEECWVYCEQMVGFKIYDECKVYVDCYYEEMMVCVKEKGCFMLVMLCCDVCVFLKVKLLK